MSYDLSPIFAVNSSPFTHPDGRPRRHHVTSCTVLALASGHVESSHGRHCKVQRSEQESGPGEPDAAGTDHFLRPDGRGEPAGNLPRDARLTSSTFAPTS